MQAPIQHKRSSEAAKVPATGDLVLGELAINTYDGKLYFKKNDGTEAIVTLSVDGHGHVKADVSGMPSGDVVGTTDTQTLANKTITAPAISDPVFSGALEEEVFALTGTAPVLDPANGTIQTHALTGNTTYTDSLANGKSLTLMIDDGANYAATWPAMVWKNNGGLAPDLINAGYTTVVLWKVDGVLYGAFVGFDS